MGVEACDDEVTEKRYDDRYRSGEKAWFHGRLGKREELEANTVEQHVMGILGSNGRPASDAQGNC